MKEWEKIFYVSGNRKNAGLSILISDKIDFKTKTVKGDKERHYIIMKMIKNKANINRQKRRN